MDNKILSAALVGAGIGAAAAAIIMKKRSIYKPPKVWGEAQQKYPFLLVLLRPPCLGGPVFNPTGKLRDMRVTMGKCVVLQMDLRYDTPMSPKTNALC